jgi:uncharacterized protein
MSKMMPKMMPKEIPKDFSRRRRFPGTESSLSDQINRLADRVERLPALLFAVLLLLVAIVPALVLVLEGSSIDLVLALTAAFWVFYLSDWALVALLPRRTKSFGPAKPPTLILACLRVIPGVLPLPWNILAQIVGTVLVIYGFWIEPHRIRVTRETLSSSKLAVPEPLRILHLGDLHVERISQRERELLDWVESLKPDLILFSGDFLSLSYLDDPITYEHARMILHGLNAPLGVFAVMGSPAVDKPDVISQLLDGLEIRCLQDERVTLNYLGQSIDLIGITCSHKPFADATTLDSVLNGKLKPFSILLYHSPDLAPEAAQRGIDLQLSGHTHGGQIRLPLIGALFAGSLYGKRFEAGRYQLDDMTLYVSRGIGLEGKGAPRVRFLCPPEIILWEISGEAPADPKRTASNTGEAGLPDRLDEFPTSDGNK